MEKRYVDCDETGRLMSIDGDGFEHMTESKALSKAADMRAEIERLKAAMRSAIADLSALDEDSERAGHERGLGDPRERLAYTLGHAVGRAENVASALRAALREDTP